MVDGRIPLKQVGGLVSTTATDWAVANITLVTSGTEYSYAVPNGTKQLIISSRTQAKLRLARNPGDTAIVYKTIWPGGSFTLTDLSFTGQTLYFQSDKNSTIVEIVELL